MLLELQDYSLVLNKNSLIQNLNLKIYPGSFLGILGANGSGKSSFLHTLAGLKNNYAGKILLESKKIQQYSVKELASIRGILFQQTNNFLYQTVYEYCLASTYANSSAYNNKILYEKILELVNLQDRQDTLVCNLSGGELRRLNLATLFLLQPKIFLLDEPTNHLDLNYQIRILNELKLLTQKKVTVVMVVHDIQIALAFCTNFLILLGNGQHLAGNDEIITQENLENIYQHPVSKQIGWYAAI